MVRERSFINAPYQGLALWKSETQRIRSELFMSKHRPTYIKRNNNRGIDYQHTPNPELFDEALQKADRPGKNYTL